MHAIKARAIAEMAIEKRVIREHLENVLSDILRAASGGSTFMYVQYRWLWDVWISDETDEDELDYMHEANEALILSLMKLGYQVRTYIDQESNVIGGFLVGWAPAYGFFPDNPSFVPDGV